MSNTHSGTTAVQHAADTAPGQDIAPAKQTATPQSPEDSKFWERLHSREEKIKAVTWLLLVVFGATVIILSELTHVIEEILRLGARVYELVIALVGKGSILS